MKRSVSFSIVGALALSTGMLLSGGCGSEPTPPAAPVEIHDSELQQMEEEEMQARAESASVEGESATESAEAASTERTEATDLP